MESRKRKPLSDISNTYNLIPTSALRELVASTSKSNSFSKPPILILKPNASSTNQKLCSDSSNRSDTSIGSSNVSATRNSRTVQFRTPPRVISSIFSPEGGVGSKDAADNQTRTIQKSKKETEAEVVIVSPIPVEKSKDKGKAIAIPFSSSPPEGMKDNQKVVVVSPVAVEKRKDKGKAIAIGKRIVDHSSCSLEKANDGKKGILDPSGSSVVKTKEMGKEFVTPSSFLVERRKEKGKPLNCSSSSREKTREKRKVNLQLYKTVAMTKHKESSAAVAVNCKPPRRKSEKGKNDAGASSCPPMVLSKRIQNDLDEAGDSKSSKSWTDPHPKGRKKRCSRREISSELPLDFIEQQRAYFKEVDEFELPEEEVSQDELD